MSAMKTLWVPIGWTPRVMMLLGTAFAVFAATGPWISWVIYVMGWTLTYQFILAAVYFRAKTHAARDDCDFFDAVEMGLNNKVVALDDLAKLCSKYGIPPEEVVPIIERGYGIRVTMEGDE